MISEANHKCKLKIFYENTKGGLERCPSGDEWVRLFRRTTVWFLAAILGGWQQPVTSLRRQLMSSSGLHGHSHACAHTHRLHNSKTKSVFGERQKHRCQRVSKQEGGAAEPSAGLVIVLWAAAIFFLIMGIFYIYNQEAFFFPVLSPNPGPCVL